MENLKIKELTKENEEKYLDKVVELEKIVLESMEKEGKIGQLFITGKEDISEYVHSKQNTVMIAVDKMKMFNLQLILHKDKRLLHIMILQNILNMGRIIKNM